ncbi:hypothetical protein HPB48_007750 [Haemaphysalis longicornis]|uniref:Uncharacterized protein n=1 Tax=Haemaphysalis longicornis TaxID=44386 RepID=A0A9J6FRZ8_HAELO|nr:hypothetical protein HPB48_007750 [Haemaphysalis longicornis]
MTPAETRLSWAAVSGRERGSCRPLLETVRYINSPRLIRRRDLHERLASAIHTSAALPTTSNSVREEVFDLMFDSESDCSFDGFDDE